MVFSSSYYSKGRLRKDAAPGVLGGRPRRHFKEQSSRPTYQGGGGARRSLDEKTNKNRRQKPAPHSTEPFGRGFFFFFFFCFWFLMQLGQWVSGNKAPLPREPSKIAGGGRPAKIAMRLERRRPEVLLCDFFAKSFHFSIEAFPSPNLRNRDWWGIRTALPDHRDEILMGTARAGAGYDPHPKGIDFRGSSGRRMNAPAARAGVRTLFVCRHAGPT